jgi:hypothetical protein
MKVPLVPLLLTCGPLLLSTAAAVETIKDYRRGQLRALALAAVAAAWSVSAYAASVFLYYTLKPSPYLPPWKDPETLSLALLFLLAPVGLVATVIAGIRGASKWTVLSLVAAMLVLSFVGLIEGNSV